MMKQDDKDYFKQDWAVAIGCGFLLICALAFVGFVWGLCNVIGWFI